METWEQEDTEDKLGGLNINANEFVPGRNIFASSFVPVSTAPVVPATTNDVPKAVPEPQNSEAEKSSQNWEEAQPTPASGDKEEDYEDEDVEEDEEDDDDEEKEEVVKKKKPVIIAPEFKKESVNVVFIGHVDAGKSTIGGHILFLTGMVDKRTLEKFEREAKERNRETWYLSYALDTNIEERDKGKTVECGRGYFETENKHFILLDAPGHKSFVPNMIVGAAQADLAILVISARRGEFETGFEKGGQTREHAMLVKTAGVKHMIVLINKMDDPTVEWDEERFEECKNKLIPYLKKVGFNPKTDLCFIPCSGLTGAFIRDCVSESVCPWYRGPALLPYLETLPSLSRSKDGPLRLPIGEKFKDMGTFVSGKVESGCLAKGQQLILMPNKVSVEVLQVLSDDCETEEAVAGDNVKLKLKNVEEDEVSPGFVLCTQESLCKIGSIFDAQFVILEHKSIVCAGYTAVMHLHCCVEEVTLNLIICTLDKRTNAKKTIKPRFIRQDEVAVGRFQVNGGSICMETFKDFQQMGRFTLRDEGKTIAIGKILKVLPTATD